MAPKPVTEYHRKMQFTIHIPDEVLDEYREAMPPPELGLLEAIAVDAIIASLQRLQAARAEKGEP